MGHLDGFLFWALAIPSYLATAYTARIVIRLVREEIWYRRAVRRARSI
jgi:hypothetical protein